MIGYEEAYRHIIEHASPLEAVEADLAGAIGMVAAEDVYSDIDMPPFDKAAMDGFAVRSEDTASPPFSLQIIGEVRAGENYNGVVSHGEAVRIMTGAPIPIGADSVIMVEDTEALEGSKVKIKREAAPNDNIHKCRSYISRGEMVMTKGRVIDACDVPILATVGKSAIKVIRRPTVALFATGDELVNPDTIPKKNRIRDCNTPTLTALLRKDGFSAANLGIVKDDPAALTQTIGKGLKNDVLLLTGGVSAGKYDFIPDVLGKLGVQKIFHKVRIKPGKPLFFGRLRNKLVFGIPGNPISAFVVYHLFVRPAIAAMMGIRNSKLNTESGILTRDIARSDLRKEFLPSKLFLDNGRWRLEPATSYVSADPFVLAKSAAFVIVEEGIEKICAGSVVEFVRW